MRASMPAPPSRNTARVAIETRSHNTVRPCGPAAAVLDARFARVFSRHGVGAARPHWRRRQQQLAPRRTRSEPCRLSCTMHRRPRRQVATPPSARSLIRTAAGPGPGVGRVRPFCPSPSMPAAIAGRSPLFPTLCPWPPARILLAPSPRGFATLLRVPPVMSRASPSTGSTSPAGLQGGHRSLATNTTATHTHTRTRTHTYNRIRESRLPAGRPGPPCSPLAASPPRAATRPDRPSGEAAPLGTVLVVPPVAASIQARLRRPPAPPSESGASHRWRRTARLLLRRRVERSRAFPGLSDPCTSGDPALCPTSILVAP